MLPSTVEGMRKRTPALLEVVRQRSMTPVLRRQQLSVPNYVQNLEGVVKVNDQVRISEM